MEPESRIRAGDLALLLAESGREEPYLLPARPLEPAADPQDALAERILAGLVAGR